MLGRRHPVGVDRLDVPRIGLAPPADHELLRNRLPLVHLALWHHGQAEAAGRLGRKRQCGHGEPGEIVTSLLVGAVE